MKLDNYKIMHLLCAASEFLKLWFVMQQIVTYIFSKELVQWMGANAL